MRYFLACLAIVSIIAMACAGNATAVGNGQNGSGAIGNGSAGGAAPTATPTPLARMPIKIYAGCTGDFIHEYNPDFSFANATRQNTEQVENTNTIAGHTANCTAASQTNIYNSCPVVQVPIPGTFGCHPEVYFTASQAGAGSGCNNHSFYTAHHADTTPQADWYHSTTPLSEANVSQNAGYCSSTNSYAVRPNSTDFESYIAVASATSVLNGIPANGYGFRDDTFICVATTDCAGGLNIGFNATFAGGSPVDCSPIPSCLIAAEAAFHDFMAPLPLDLNGLPAGGQGFANINMDNISVFTTETQTNDKLITVEQCMASVDGTDTSSGCIALINTCLALQAATTERCVFLNNFTPNSTLQNFVNVSTAISWFALSGEAAYGYSAANRVTDWWDRGGGGISANDVDLYNEEDIWPCPFCGQFLPTGQNYVRAYNNNGNFTPATGGGTGSGCGTTTGDVGGMQDALIAGTCATGNNGKPVGVYAVEFTQCYYQETTGGANINLGHCAIVWNPRSGSAYSLASSGTLHYTYPYQITHNGLEMQHAIGGTLVCTNCTGTITASPITYPLSIAAKDAAILCQNSFATQ